MNKKTIILMLLVMFLFPLTILPVHTGFNTTDPIYAQTIVALKSTSSVSSPINITSNAQLAAQASAGDGSSVDPYIIENILINSCAPNISGISIRNTDKYFILRNISVSHCLNGFYFNNVTFGSIIDSSATDDSQGFGLYNSNTNTLTNNKATKNSYSFYLSRAFNNTLTNNIATNDNESYGFYLIFASDNTLTNNTATNDNDGYGFYLIFASDNNVLTNNTARNNHRGFYLLVSSNNNVLINNTAKKNYRGFYLSYSTYNVLASNKAINNSDYGFYLEYSANNTLEYNIGAYNGLYDYFADNSGNNILISNTFLTTATTTHIRTIIDLSFYYTLVSIPAMLSMIGICVVLDRKSNNTMMTRIKTMKNGLNISTTKNSTMNLEFCSTCGIPVVPGYQYCINCGTKLKTESSNTHN